MLRSVLAKMKVHITTNMAGHKSESDSDDLGAHGIKVTTYVQYCEKLSSGMKYG